MASDPTDADREALAKLIRAADNEFWGIGGADRRFVAHLTKRILAAGYRSPAFLLRAWERGRDAAATACVAAEKRKAAGAYTRGAEAMREALVAKAGEIGFLAIEDIRALPVPDPVTGEEQDGD